jgi:ATP-dependent helicase/nuclease subunit B
VYAVLKFILGGAGSGKTGYILSEIKARVEAKTPGLVLLTPEQYSHRLERQLAAVCGPSVSLYAEVLSFTRLYSRVATQTGGLSDVIPDKGGKLLLLNLALDQISSKLRYYGVRSRRAEFLSLILDTAEELLSANLGYDDLLSASEMTFGTVSDKLYDMALIIEAYNAVLSSRLGDSRDRIKRLADSIHLSSVGSGGIYIDGFTDFTACEYEVIDGLLKRGTDITIALTYIDKEAEHFRLTEGTFHELSRLAGRRAVPVEVINLRPERTYNAPSIHYLAERLFDYSAPAFKGKTEAVELYRMSSPLRECRLAAARILEILRSDETLCFSDFIVAAPDYNAYSATLESVFHDYGIPMYSGEKSGLAEKSLIAFVLEALEIINSGWLYKNMFRYLKTGLVSINPDDRDLLENYCLTWDIRGEALWTRQEPWDMNPRGYVQEWTLDDTRQVSKLDSLRRAIASPLQSLSAALKRSATARDYIYALWRFLEDSSLEAALSEKSKRLFDAGLITEAEEYSRLWDILISCLEQFHEVLGSLPMETEEFIRMLELLLSGQDIGTIPAALDCVLTGSLNRLKGSRPKCLIILGADDASLPSLSGSGGLFSEDERRTLFDLGLKLGSDRDESIYRELHSIYQSVGSVDKKLIVTYTGGENRRPSLLINRARVLLGLKVIDENELNCSYMTAAANPCFSLALSGSGEAALAAAECVDKAELSRLLSLTKLDRGSLSPEAVRLIYGSKFNLTATRTENFNSCRFMYFMQYGLKAKERKKAGFEAPELGTFVHYVLENVCAEAKTLGGFKVLGEEEIRRLTDKHTKAYVSKFFSGNELNNPRFSYLFNRLRASVDSIVSDVASELSVSDFEPLDFELQFADGAALPPAEVENVKISGTVDRVDGWLNTSDGKLYLRVADYKTGKKEFSFSDVYFGLGIQMLIYLFVLAEHGRARYGKEVVPAGVLYTPARDVFLPLPRSSSLEEIQKKRSDILRRSGLILSDASVIEAMEHGDSTRYIPVKFKDGVPTGSVASAEQLSKLSSYIKTLLKNMGDELQQGCISANPLEKGKSHSPCMYCSFKSACLFDRNRDNPRRQFALKADEFWQLISQFEKQGEGALPNA